jgi:hypothetical protein
MLIREIIELIQPAIVTGEIMPSLNLERAFSSDLMSDVLTVNSEGLLLITGLNNMQTIRTAEMAEISVVLLVRNKRPSHEMIELARKEGILLMVSEKSMFRVSGLLFQAGLNPVF